MRETEIIRREELEAMKPVKYEERGGLPMAYMAGLTRDASAVWNYLRRRSETPAEVIKAFDNICERLNIPYVIEDG